MLLIDKLSNLGLKIILASASPRRKDLLTSCGIEYEVRIIDGIDEQYPPTLLADQVAEYLALKKSEYYSDTLDSNEILITADTVVVCDDIILGKPQNYSQAVDMLQNLSGKIHTVITGIVLKTKSDVRHFSSRTLVSFNDLSSEQIEFYVNNFKPYDKAGAYGIQEWIGFIGIGCIQGSFYNVMGLPTDELYKQLDSLVDTISDDNKS